MQRVTVNEWKQLKSEGFEVCVSHNTHASRARYVVESKEAMDRLKEIRESKRVTAQNTSIRKG